MSSIFYIFTHSLLFFYFNFIFISFYIAKAIHFWLLVLYSMEEMLLSYSNIIPSIQILMWFGVGFSFHLPISRRFRGVFHFCFSFLQRFAFYFLIILCNDILSGIAGCRSEKIIKYTNILQFLSFTALQTLKLHTLNFL